MTQLITKLRSRFTSALLAMTIMLSLASCGSSKYDDTLPSLFSLFATLESHSKTGAVFSVQSTEPGATPITLTTNANLESEGLTVGERYIIIFSNGSTDKPFMEGPIDLKNVLRIANGNVQIASSEEINALKAASDYEVQALTLTGTFVNVQVRVPSTSNPVAFNIYADRATLESPYPQLYLIYQINSTGLSSTTAFGSFNIADVWDRPTCKGVNINLLSHPEAKFEK